MAAHPLAALSSNLLARPGHAKPAMRPQGFAYATVDDLGWNDMGQEAAQSAVQATPTPVSPALSVAPVPPVLTERATLTRAVTTPAAPRSSTGPMHRTAFTLRLDPDRHLRLRLASAVAGRSSQQLLVEALDAFLAAQPQVEALARQVPGPVHHFSGEKP